MYFAVHGSGAGVWFLVSPDAEHPDKTWATDGDGGVFGCGISLGDYIILDYDNYWQYRYYDSLYRIYNHEHGHQKQSLKLGWLYLLTIGILSACGNLVDRIVHKYHKHGCWYYKQPWEKWADKLGQVQR